MDSLPAEVVEIIIEYVEDAYMEGPLESYGVPFLAMVNRRFYIQTRKFAYETIYVENNHRLLLRTLSEKRYGEYIKSLSFKDNGPTNRVRISFQIMSYCPNLTYLDINFGNKRHLDPLDSSYYCLRRLGESIRKLPFLDSLIAFTCTESSPTSSSPSTSICGMFLQELPNLEELHILDHEADDWVECLASKSLMELEHFSHVCEGSQYQNTNFINRALALNLPLVYLTCSMQALHNCLASPQACLAMGKIEDLTITHTDLWLDDHPDGDADWAKPLKHFTSLDPLTIAGQENDMSQAQIGVFFCLISETAVAARLKTLTYTFQVCYIRTSDLELVLKTLSTRPSFFPALRTFNLTCFCLDEHLAEPLTISDHFYTPSDYDRYVKFCGLGWSDPHCGLLFHLYEQIKTKRIDIEVQVYTGSKEVLTRNSLINYT